MKVTKDSSLEDLYQTGKINTRIYNGLLRYFRMAYPDRFEYYTAGTQIKIADICKLSYHKLMLIQNLGTASINILCTALDAYGFTINGFKEVKETAKAKARKMSPKDFEQAMHKICDPAATGDEELAHMNADKLMCELLNSLGYDKGIKIFEQTPKYYA